MAGDRLLSLAEQAELRTQVNGPEHLNIRLGWVSLWKRKVVDEALDAAAAAALHAINRHYVARLLATSASWPG